MYLLKIGFIGSEVGPYLIVRCQRAIRYFTAS